jgi:hypothetical protein
LVALYGVNVRAVVTSAEFKVTAPVRVLNEETAGAALAGTVNAVVTMPPVVALTESTLPTAGRPRLRSGRTVTPLFAAWLKLKLRDIWLYPPGENHSAQARSPGVGGSPKVMVVVLVL